MRDIILCLIALSSCVSILSGQNKNNPYPEFKPVSNVESTQLLNCNIEKDQSGITAAGYQELLHFTHPELKRFMQGKELIEIYASVSTGGDDYFIDMRYIFNTAKAVENYGSHSKGALVKVSLLNKEILYFKNLKTSRAKIKEKEGVSMLTASYLLDEYEVKQLLKSPVMAMEVTYQYGTESYPVQNITMLGDQIRCLENTK